MYDGCRRPPPEVPIQPEYYSPIEIKPMTFKQALAILLWKCRYKTLRWCKLSLILNNLNTHWKKFQGYWSFDIFLEIILTIEKGMEQSKTQLIDLLKDANIILYLLAISWDDKIPYLMRWIFGFSETGSVIQRLSTDFSYKEEGNEIKFRRESVYKLALDVIKKYPRIKGNIISTDGKPWRLQWKTRTKFYWSSSNCYNAALPRSEYKSYDHSFIPISEVEITCIQGDGLLAKIIGGNENEIKSGYGYIKWRRMKWIISSLPAPDIKTECLYSEQSTSAEA